MNKPEDKLDAALELIQAVKHYPGAHSMKIVGKEQARQAILSIINEARVSERIEAAQNKPTGDALEIKVPRRTMQYVMSKIKLKDETIAARTLEPLWLIKKWRKGTGDKYDLEVQIWVLRILASLTHRFNWSIFLLKPENIKELTNSNRKGRK